MPKRRRAKSLGTLHPRDGGVATGPHDLSALVSKLPGVQLFGPNTWVFDTGEGRNVRIVVAHSRVEFDGVFDPRRFYDEEHGTWEDDDAANAPLFDAVEELARPIQRVTRWPLTLSQGDEIEADEPCPKCKALCFEWEDMCPSCGADIMIATSVGPSLDDDDELARRVLSVLIEAGHIEIDGARRRSIESVLAATFGNFGGAATLISKNLIEHPAVEELYCDEAVLEEVIEAAQRRQ
jgi:hypothetical protein